MPIVPDHDSPEITLRESAAQSATDATELAADLAIGIPDPARSAKIAERLSEEFAETGLMLRALPRRPLDGISGLEAQLLAALRTAHAAGQDIGEVLGHALARLAAELGSRDAVVANRPGSWEATHVLELLLGTTGVSDLDAGDQILAWRAW